MYTCMLLCCRFIHEQFVIKSANAVFLCAVVCYCSQELHKTKNSINVYVLPALCIFFIIFFSFFFTVNIHSVELLMNKENIMKQQLMGKNSFGISAGKRRWRQQLGKDH